jgi:Tol biopolymer transport system component
MAKTFTVHNLITMKRLHVVLLVCTLLLGVWCPASTPPLQAQQPLWLRYPAISPDGKTVCFSYKGDLWLVPSTGGRATQLTQHEGHDMRPVWSPDGKTLAFASERHGNMDVFTIAARGGTPKRLTFHSNDEFPTSFTPDGNNVVFYATRLDSRTNAQFPNAYMSELYSVPAQGGAVRQLLTTPAQDASYNKAGTMLVFHDRKSGENEWRKHHTSAVTRDIWTFDTKTGTYAKLTTFAGEDRNPVWSPDNTEILYLSEQSGSFNVWKFALAAPTKPTQITTHRTHPVRSLSVAQDGTLCYSFDGELYLRAPSDKESRKISVEIAVEDKKNSEKFQLLTTGATEFAVSPNGKEIAVVVRGEIFVCAVDYDVTKRITTTPEQERSVSFSPDGRSLLYAGERNGSWNLYQISIVKNKDDEPYFYKATTLKEETLLATPAEEFQPKYSPDGSEVAYLHERTRLHVLNLKSKQTRQVLDSSKNFSYSDGDIAFDWSPDGAWLLCSTLGKAQNIDEISLVDAQGKKPPVNLSQSGYEDNLPRWALGGTMMLWVSSQYGFKSHGSQGWEYDVLGAFFSQDAFDRFRLNREEFEALKAKESEKSKPSGDKTSGDKKDAEKSAEQSKKPLELDLANLDSRKVRLTLHSSDLAGYVLSPDGERLYYLSKFEKGYDVWLHKLRDKETKLLTKLDAQNAQLAQSNDGKHLFVLTSGQTGALVRIDTANGQQKRIAFRAEGSLNAAAEREYLFEHTWRQMLKKFYRVDMQGVDWAAYKREYAKYLPHISNNWEFAELMSEMLGELNASHTGCRYSVRFDPETSDQTASLGFFPDETFAGQGIKIAEILENSPLARSNSLIKPGTVIETIDGVAITADRDAASLLNRKADKPLALRLLDPTTNKRWEETVKPIPLAQEQELLYQRWIKKRREDTERLSKGRIGYVHIRSMNDASFRPFYADVMGRYADKEAIIVDTRYNGGGWLHEDLVTLLAGKRYATFFPRGQEIGSDPVTKWQKKSIVVMSEGNYSNAHGFPYSYRALGLGKLVGTPVAGTATSVWWETLQDNTLVFGIPQIGKFDTGGTYLENQQLEPDELIYNDPESVSKGRDMQIEKAVEVLLKELDKR